MARTLPSVAGHKHVLGVDCGAHSGGRFFERLRACAEEVFAQVSDDHTQFISGHFRYRDVADLIAPLREKTIVTTFLRDPVERMLSDYLYCTTDAHDDQAGFLARFPDFDSYMADPTQFNKQLAYLQPHEGASVAETIDFLRETFDFIGLTERFDGDFARFATNLGLTPAEPARTNVGRNKAPLEDLRARYGEQLAERLAPERALYDAMKDINWLDRRNDLLIKSEVFTMTTDQKEVHSDTDLDLLRKIDQLGPWHHRIALNDRVFTRQMAKTNDPDAITVTEPRNVFRAQALPLFPNGMAGKSFLDCGCNAGGYCFAAKDAGADRTFGFDVRQHWIDQAEFVRTERMANSDGMRFKVADLLDLQAMDEEFDVTWFSGLLYHLPDPVRGLKIAADKTRDLIFVNTAVQKLQEGEAESMSLRMKFEGVEQLMSGVHHLSWLPGGPQSLRMILNWLGFPETRLLFWHQQTARGERGRSGRLAMVAAREPGRLAAIKDAAPINYVS